MVARNEEKKYLSAKGLLKRTREVFSTVKDPIAENKKSSSKLEYSIVDCLMSGFAIFGMKFSSLLQFDKEKNEETVRHNLKSL